jgi:hypothetical protein
MGDSGGERMNGSDMRTCAEGHEVGSADVFCPVCLSPKNPARQWIPNQADD